jgi:hypothetical protein
MMAVFLCSHHYESLVQKSGAYDSMCGCGVCRNRRTPFLCLFFSFPTAMESFSRTAVHKTACAAVECVKNTPPQCNDLSPLDSDTIILKHIRGPRMFRWTPCRRLAINNPCPFFLWTFLNRNGYPILLCVLLEALQKPHVAVTMFFCARNAREFKIYNDQLMCVPGDFSKTQFEVFICSVSL